MVWTPSAAAREAGERNRGVIPYVGGSTIAPGEAIQIEPRQGTQELANFIRARFSAGVSSVGIRRPADRMSPAQRADGTFRKRDVHESGRAGDVMIRTLSAGAEVADFLVTHALALGIQYVIFNRFEWSASRVGPAFEPYETSADRVRMGRDRARSPHTDHVHFEQSPAWADDGARVRAALQSLAPGFEWRAAGVPRQQSTAPRQPTPQPPAAAPSGASRSAGASLFDAGLIGTFLGGVALFAWSRRK